MEEISLEVPMVLTRRPLLTALGVIALIAIVVAGLFAFTAPRPPSNGVSVRRGTISTTVTATGKVRAKRSVRLSLPQSGVIDKVSKLEGDPVNAGDVILSL